MIENPSPFRRRIKDVLFSLAALCIIVALAGPQVNGGKARFKKKGIDVVLAFDFSKSMLARDIYPNRIKSALEHGRELTEKLRSNRVSTVAFAGSSSYFPLSHDHRASFSLVDVLEPGDLSGGSNVSLALRLSQCVLQGAEISSKCAELLGAGEGGNALDGGSLGPPLHRGIPRVSKRAKALVLFSDGEENLGNIDQVLLDVMSSGISVYWVGVGSDAGELIPLSDGDDNWLHNEKGELVRTRLQRKRLLELASISGGENHFFDLDGDKKTVSKLVRALNRLKKGSQVGQVTRDKRPVHSFFLWCAFLFLFIDFFLHTRKKERKEDGMKAQRRAIVFVLMCCGSWNWPRSTDRKVERANALADKGRYEKSEKLYVDAGEKKGSEGYKIDYNRGLLYAKWGEASKEDDVRQRRFAKAALYLSKASNTRDQGLRSKCLSNLGNVFLAQGDVEDAIASYRDSLLIAPGDANTIHNLGLALHMLKNKQNADSKGDPENQSKKAQPKSSHERSQVAKDDKKTQNVPVDDKGAEMGERNNKMNDALKRMERLEKRSKTFQRKKVQQRSELVQQKEPHVTW